MAHTSRMKLILEFRDKFCNHSKKMTDSYSHSHLLRKCSFIWKQSLFILYESSIIYSFIIALYESSIIYTLFYCLCDNCHILQKLRCKCNFHALKFVPKIQEAGSLLIRRIRKYDTAQRMLDKQLVGEFLPGSPSKKHDSERGPSKYLALHLRFEVDMIAYSLCDFGGGEKEKRELQAYRESHFPLLIERLKHSKYEFLQLLNSYVLPLNR